mmetsp:Transcript_146266/g.255449  ORF Transcript_146266/g.255449 Transcript_146266/m.255449 type:complete len:251 (-) Transcript_146266:46-798(-)
MCCAGKYGPLVNSLVPSLAHTVVTADPALRPLEHGPSGPLLVVAHARGLLRHVPGPGSASVPGIRLVPGVLLIPALLKSADLGGTPLGDGPAGTLQRGTPSPIASRGFGTRPRPLEPPGSLRSPRSFAANHRSSSSSSSGGPGWRVNLALGHHRARPNWCTIILGAHLLKTCAATELVVGGAQEFLNLASHSYRRGTRGHGARSPLWPNGGSLFSATHVLLNQLVLPQFVVHFGDNPSPHEVIQLLECGF